MMNHAPVAGQFLEGARRWPRDGFCQVEVTMVFALAEVLGAKQFLGANDLSPLSGGVV